MTNRSCKREKQSSALPVAASQMRIKTEHSPLANHSPDNAEIACCLTPWLRGIMTGRHFHPNMKVQTAMCKDNSNSKSRAATYVKFDIYIYIYLYIMILVDYIEWIKYSVFNTSV